jgi:undecaprenyl-diphosphatase
VGRWRALLADAERLDLAVHDAITQTSTPNLDVGMRRLTQLADCSRLWLACAAVLSATRGARGRRAALVGLRAVAISSALANLVLKPMGARRRPDASALAPQRRAPTPASTSFPSGHAASAFAFASAVGVVLGRESIPIRALAALVAYSRVHTGVHYPGDVLAGAFLGTTIGHASARRRRPRRGATARSRRGAG